MCHPHHIYNYKIMVKRENNTLYNTNIYCNHYHLQKRQGSKKKNISLTTISLTLQPLSLNDYASNINDKMLGEDNPYRQ